MDIIRNGNFSSSEIVALLSMGSREMTEHEIEEYKKANPKSRKRTIESWPGEAALTYIEECRMERRLGRSIENESNARPLTWGLLMEKLVFNILGIEYRECSKETLVHPFIKEWVGSPDGEHFEELEEDRAVVEVKNPVTLKSFCQLVDPLYNGLSGMEAMNAIRKGYTDKNGVEHDKHKDGEKYYWQCVSNAILKKAKHAELIVHAPYASQLDDIRFLAQKAEGADMKKYYWIIGADESELPLLIDGGFYKNINVIRFTIPEEDKTLLTTRVKQGVKLLLA